MKMITYNSRTLNDIKSDDDVMYARLIIIDRIFQAARSLCPKIDDYEIIIEHKQEDSGRILRGDEEDENMFCIQFDIEKDSNLDLFSRAIGLFAAVICDINGDTDKKTYKEILDDLAKNSISFDFEDMEIINEGDNDE